LVRGAAGRGGIPPKKQARKYVARGAVAKKSPLALWAEKKSETAASFLGGQARGQHPPTCAYIADFSERRPLVLPWCFRK